MTTTWVEPLRPKRRETCEHGVSPFPYQAAFSSTTSGTNWRRC